MSQLELKRSGGGAFAVNWYAFEQLGRHFDAEYCGPIPLREGRFEAMWSKVRRRVLGVPGKFVAFSPATLACNAGRVRSVMPEDLDALMFKSAAPWAAFNTDLPYFVYLDAVFETFFYNTFRLRDFIKGDLERIWAQEAQFLVGAAGVFFESRWGMERAKEAYGMDGRNFHVVGRGGVLEPPGEDCWDGESLTLVTLAMKFRQKGGDLVLEAYQRLKPQYPGLKWQIIGGPPEGDWESVDGIFYEGVLRPDEAAGRARLEAILGNAFLLVHPTREDVNPLVVTEAGYFGCPTISVDRFALPELVLQERSGILLPYPPSVDAVVEAIERLILDRELYRQMRGEARRHALEHSQWDGIGDRMSEVIRERLG